MSQSHGSSGRRGEAAASVADRLRHARRRRFVGRHAELGMLREALESPLPPFTVAFIHGPAGVGKTALLRRVGDLAADAGLESAYLDLRSIGADPAAFRAALERHGGEPRVLLLDTFERAAGIEGWLRAGFLPSLPADQLVVIAGRQPPSRVWRDDPGWRELLRTVPLRNLAPDEAREMLTAAEAPESLLDSAAALTHGHPLAISMLIDLFDQRLADDAGSFAGRDRIEFADAPDLVSRLQALFLEEAPSEAHRQALQASAIARSTTEDLLRDALRSDDARAIFDWLGGLSFIEAGPFGLHPHDLVRDVIEADLRWRAPQLYRELRRRVRGHVIERARSGPREARRRAAADLVYLHRANPFGAAQWDWASFGHAYGDALRDSDRAPLLAMTERHEGEAAAALIDHWLKRRPESFMVVRDESERPRGFLCRLALHEIPAEERAADPGAEAMWEYAQRHGPTRPGEEVFASRALIDAEAHQAPSPTLNMTTVFSTQEFLTRPRLAWELIGAWVDADAAAPFMSYIDFHRAEEADYEIGGRRYFVFAHDWRRADAERWLELMESREATDEPLASPPDPPDPVIALSRPEFETAVRQALKDLHRDEALAASPLIRSRLVREATAGEDSAGEADALRGLIEQAAWALRADPRGEKHYRAVARTYLRPAATQEMAADALGLPFSTYRRHLRQGVERMTDWLWQRELYGAGVPANSPARD